MDRGRSRRVGGQRCRSGERGRGLSEGRGTEGRLLRERVAIDWGQMRSQRGSQGDKQQASTAVIPPQSSQSGPDKSQINILRG